MRGILIIFLLAVIAASAGALVRFYQDYFVVYRQMLDAASQPTIAEPISSSTPPAPTPKVRKAQNLNLNTNSFDPENF